MFMPEVVEDMAGADSAADISVDSEAGMEEADMVVDSGVGVEEAGAEAVEDGPVITGEHIPAIMGESITAAGTAHTGTGITTMLIPAIVFTSVSPTIMGRRTMTGLITPILHTIQDRGLRALQRRRRISNKAEPRRCNP
jgi:hypothetical protein